MKSMKSDNEECIKNENGRQNLFGITFYAATYFCYYLSTKFELIYTKLNDTVPLYTDRSPLLFIFPVTNSSVKDSAVTVGPSKTPGS